MTLMNAIFPYTYFMDQSRQQADDYNRAIQPGDPNSAATRNREQFLRGRTMSDFDAGIQRGRELLTNDPRMQQYQRELQDLSRGYSGQELGAMRGIAADELAGQRSQYLRQLASRTGRGGVGGARAAAMQGAADQNFLRARAEQERKMALDSAQLRRQGAKDYGDFLMRQRFGELSTGAGMAGLAQSAYAQAGQERSAADAARIATTERPRGILGEVLRPLFG